MLKIPYGKGFMSFEAPERRIKAVLRGTERFSAAKEEGMSEKEIVLDALAHPVGSPGLHELAVGKQSVTIITSDHTRPMPSRVTMPLLLEEIRKGSPDADVLILIATGLHRATTDEELVERFGEGICKEEKIVVHDCRNNDSLRKIGVLPSGGDLVLSKYALDTDLLIAEGFIEPHFFAGFSGGRKSVLPGIAGYECVVSNHSSLFIADKKASSGVLCGNPVHRDMAFGAKAAGLAFILNVMLDEEHVIDGAVAGNPETAHAEGCERFMKKAAVKRVNAPIVISGNGGYPLDQNLYQLVKCMDTAEKCCDEGGVIIAVGECRDGVGGESFYRDFAGGGSPRELTELFLSRKPSGTAPDQWQSQILARILEKHRVIVVAPLIEENVRRMGLGFAANLNDALALADDWLRKPGEKLVANEASEVDIVVIPNGPGVVIVA